MTRLAVNDLKEAMAWGQTIKALGPLQINGNRLQLTPAGHAKLKRLVAVLATHTANHGMCTCVCCEALHEVRGALAIPVSPPTPPGGDTDT